MNNEDALEIDVLNEYTAFIQVANYGDYQIGFRSCGEVGDTITLKFLPETPYLMAADHQNCFFTIDLSAITNDMSAGPWEQVSGPSVAQIMDPESKNTEVIVSEYGLYQFSFFGCGSTNIIEVGVSCPITVPNSFSPNGDGVNDLFIISELTPFIYSQSVLYVYNKWGRIVYMHSSYGLDASWWDGRKTNHAKGISSFIPNRYQGKLDYVNDGIYFFVNISRSKRNSLSLI